MYNHSFLYICCARNILHLHPILGQNNSEISKLGGKIYAQNLTMKAKGSGKIPCQFKTLTTEQHERISGPHSQSVEVKKNTFYSERRLSLVKPGSQRGVSLFKTDPMTHGGIVKKKNKKKNICLPNRGR